MSHNPHMPELYELCDEMGFFVIDEAFDEWEGAKINGPKAITFIPLYMRGIIKTFPYGRKKI